MLGASATLAPAPAQTLAAESFTLGNGMTVILREDHSLPRVAINLLYRAGSRDDPPGKSGFAHLFEHLMFMGTSRVPGNDFDTLMEASGGSNNAFTEDDYTDYYSAGPSELLPTLLWLDADRLEDLARAMDQEKLDRQRAVVLNERRQNYQDAPYGGVYLALPELLFPPEHPYHRSGIGNPVDLNGADLDDVRDFFADFYTPSNVSLAVVGDFETAGVRSSIERWFGTLPAGHPPARATPAPVALTGTVRRTLYDHVDQPAVVYAWPSAPRASDADAALALAAGVLGDGKSSRLYQRLVVRDAVATDVSVAERSQELVSTFQLFVTAKPGADLDAIEHSLDEEIAQLGAEGPTAAELGRAQAQRERSLLADLQSFEAVAERLNLYQYFYHRPDALAADLGRYRSATIETVRQAVRETLAAPSGRVVVRVLPVASARTASPRDERPLPGAEKPFSPPAPESFQLANGIPVYLWHQSALPLVAITARFASALPPPGKAGVTGLAAEMLTEGAAGKDSAAFAAALANLGASLTTHASVGGEHANLFVPRRGLAEAVALLADAVRRPNLHPDDFQRVQSLALDALRRDQNDNADVAARVARRVFFGELDPLAFATDGNLASVARLSLADVQAQLQRDLRPDGATLYVAGDVSTQELRGLLEDAFGDWHATAPAAGPTADAPTRSAKPTGLRLIVVDRPESAQTAIRFLLPGASALDPRRLPLGLLDRVLGGTFTSRLNLNLRERHGYTYGAGAFSNSERVAGWQVAAADVQTDKTTAALAEFLRELRRVQTGDISAEELAKAVAAHRSTTISSVADLQVLAGTAAQLADRGLGFSTLDDDLRAAKAVGTAQINRLARSSMTLDGAVLVLVGDTAKFLPRLGELRLPKPEARDVEGAPLTAHR